MSYMDVILEMTLCKFRFLLLNSGYKVCTSWVDGLYLLTNTTNAGTKLSFCVPDWSLSNPRYINNPVSMQCQGKCQPF